MTSPTLPLHLVSDTPLPLPDQKRTNPAKRKRFQRADRAERATLRVTPTEREGRMLSDLFLWGWAKAQALYLTAYSFTETPLPVKGANAPKQPETGMANVAKRFKLLWDKGYVSKFDPKGRYVKGSEWPVYSIEDGKASALGELHMRRRDVTDEEWERLIENTADIRELVISTMTSLGFDADQVKRVIHNNSDLGIKFVSTEISGVEHRVLCSQLLAILWFGARTRGLEIGHPLPDGQVNFSFEEYVLDSGGNQIPDGHGGYKTKNVIIEPDFYFDLANDGYAIEAETGASGRAKIEQKVTNYLKLFKLHGIDGIKVPVGNPDLKSVRVIFYCATAAHARLVQDVIADLTKGKGTGLMVTALASDFHLGDEPRCEVWTREHFLKNLPTANGTPLYAHLAARISAPLLTVVTGRTHSGTQTKHIALLPPSK